jgi:hypothetical protein
VSGIEEFYVHTVSVETHTGAGAFGDTYDTPTTVDGFLEGKVQLIRDGTGQQVVSNSTFYCAVSDGPRFTPDSKVTTPDGTAYVIARNTNDAPGLTLPDHAAVYLK